MVNITQHMMTSDMQTVRNILLEDHTQSNTRDKWRYVPLQDFTSQSRFNWKKTIPQIDQQHSTYYGLTTKEQQWIESMSEKNK